MLRRYCDRCGADMAADGRYGPHIKYWKRAKGKNGEPLPGAVLTDHDGKPYEEQVDLCGECFIDLYYWLKGEERP